MSNLLPQRHLLISDTERSYNEDIGSVIDGAAWVLDGATGVCDEVYTDSPSDAHWYVKRFDEYLRKNIHDPSKSLTGHIEDGIRELKKEFWDVIPDDSISAAAEPSATCAIVRWNHDYLEYFVLCDSTFILFADNEIKKRVTDSRIEKIEEDVRQDAEKLKKQGLELEEARQQVMPKLRDNRQKKNTEGNYWVLSFDPSAATEGLTGQTDLNSEGTIYLFTDGFGRLVDRYNAYQNWESALQDVREIGIESAVEKIRRIEMDDPEGDEHFRLKQSDDITVVEISF